MQTCNICGDTYADNCIISCDKCNRLASISDIKNKESIALCCTCKTELTQEEKIESLESSNSTYCKKHNPIYSEIPNSITDQKKIYEFEKQNSFETGIKDNVNNPNHYGGKDNPYEAIKIIEAHELNFNIGNATKYILRAGKKDKSKHIEDLKKSIWYIEREIQNLTKPTVVFPPSIK